MRQVQGPADFGRSDGADLCRYFTARLGDPLALPPLKPEDQERIARLSPVRQFRRRLLRAAASLSLGVHPDALVISRNAEGRPVAGQGTLFLSASSRDDAAAVAVSPFPVGIDIEAVDAELGEAAPLAPRGEDFSPAERWAALEALAKLTGRPLEALGGWRLERRNAAGATLLGEGLAVRLHLRHEARFTIALASYAA